MGVDTAVTTAAAVVETNNLDISGAVMMVSRLPVTLNPVATRRAWLRIRAKGLASPGIASWPCWIITPVLNSRRGSPRETATTYPERKSATPSRAEFLKSSTTGDVDGFPITSSGRRHCAKWSRL
ncbi:MAG: hypothetical protein IPI48_17100 [bacterium]|nr:hypothetical protein [bacterium]